MVNISPATQMMHTYPIFTPHSLSVYRNQMIILVDGVEDRNAIAAASTIPTYTTRRTRAPSPGASSVLSRPTVTALIYHQQTGTRPAASTFPVSGRRPPCSAQTHKSPRHFERRRLRAVPSSPRLQKPRRKIRAMHARRTHPHNRTRYVCSRLRAAHYRSPGRTTSVLVRSPLSPETRGPPPPSKWACSRGAA